MYFIVFGELSDLDSVYLKHQLRSILNHYPNIQLHFSDTPFNTKPIINQINQERIINANLPKTNG